jgi:hypothetical protein
MKERCDCICDDICGVVKELSEKEGEGEAYEILDQFLEFIREEVEKRISMNFN